MKGQIYSKKLTMDKYTNQLSYLLMKVYVLITEASGTNAKN